MKLKNKNRSKGVNLEAQSMGDADSETILPSRYIKYILAGIFILSLFVRLIYFNQLETTPLFGFFSMDSTYYDSVALKILKGNFLFKETIFSYPMYPLFLSLVYLIFGHVLTVVGYCQIFFDSLTCILVYLISSKIFKDNLVGVLASFIYALYNISIFYTGFLLDVSLATFFYTLAFLLFLYAKNSAKPILWLCSGIVVGVSMLFKANIILFLPALAFYIFYINRGNISKARKALMLLFLGIFIIALPFIIRNYKIERTLTPFPAHGGLNFYIGNNPNATGVYVPLEKISDSPIDQIKTSVTIAKKEMGKGATSRDVSKYWFSKAFRFIRGNPRAYLFLIAKKFFLFWNAKEVGTNLNYYFCKKYIPLLKLPFFSFGIVAPFALLGFIFIPKAKSLDAYLLAQYVGVYIITLLLYFIVSRFRAICIPFISILASYGIWNLITFVKSGEKRKVTFSLIFLGIFFIMVNHNITGINPESNLEMSHSNLGNILYEKGGMEEAIKHYKRAIALNPDYGEAYSNLGAIYMESGMLDESIVEYQKALKLNPYSTDAHYNLGIAYASKGLFPNAIKEYKEALKIRPDRPGIYYNLGLSYAKSGMLDNAIGAYTEAIALKPRYAKAHYNLGYIYTQKGMVDKAIAEYNKVLSINPLHASAHYNLAISYYEKEDFQRAMHHYNQAVENGARPNPQFLEMLKSGK